MRTDDETRTCPGCGLTRWYAGPWHDHTSQACGEYAAAQATIAALRAERDERDIEVFRRMKPQEAARAKRLSERVKLLEAERDRYQQALECAERMEETSASSRWGNFLEGMVSIFDFLGAIPHDDVAAGSTGSSMAVRTFWVEVEAGTSGASQHGRPDMPTPDPCRAEERGRIAPLLEAAHALRLAAEVLRDETGAPMTDMDRLLDSLERYDRAEDAYDAAHAAYHDQQQAAGGAS